MEVEYKHYPSLWEYNNSQRAVPISMGGGVLHLESSAQDMRLANKNLSVFPPHNERQRESLRSNSARPTVCLRIFGLEKYDINNIAEHRNIGGVAN